MLSAPLSRCRFVAGRFEGGHQRLRQVHAELTRGACRRGQPARGAIDLGGPRVVDLDVQQPLAGRARPHPDQLLRVQVEVRRAQLAFSRASAPRQVRSRDQKGRGRLSRRNGALPAARGRGIPAAPRHWPIARTTEVAIKLLEQAAIAATASNHRFAAAEGMVNLA